jgi:hypothetical protein
MANWSNPVLTSTYTDFMNQLKDRDVDLALQFDGTTTSNLATGTIRWNSSINRWQKWNGSSWAELTTLYALTGLSTTGNASIGGTFSVTGATTLAAATATTPITSDNSTAVATTAWVRAQGFSGPTSGTSTNTPNTLVQRDGSGGFAAGTLTLTSFSYTGDPTTTSTGAFEVPVGTTAQRPTAATGFVRFNSSLTQFEGYNGTAWGKIGGGATGGGSDDVFVENGQTVTTSYTLTSGKNAVSAGPVTISSGVTVTIPSGSNWVIV